MSIGVLEHCVWLDEELVVGRLALQTRPKLVLYEESLVIPLSDQGDLKKW